MNKLKAFWNSYRGAVILNCMDNNADPTSLSYWQNYLFASSILYIIPLSLISLIPGVYMAYITGLKGMLFMDLVIVGSITGVAFIPDISVFARKLWFNGAMYFTSIILLLYLGSLGPGLLYLLGITIFIVLSLDRIYAYISVVLNVFISAGIGFVIYMGYEFFWILNEYDLGSWIAVSSNLIFLSAAAVLLIPILLDGLRASLVLESQLRSDLEKEQEWLRLLQSAIANTSESVAILEPEPAGKKWRKILYVNDAFEKMTGYSGDEAIGETLQILRGSKTSAKTINELREAVSNLQTAQTETIVYKKNGEEFWAHISVAPVSDEKETSNHWICVFRDVTERRNRMDRIKESLEEKETLLMEIHHRVKNNLAIVSSMIQLQAIEEEDKELQQKLYDTISRIYTMAEIHEFLYQTKSFSKLDFTENLKNLVKMIVELMDSEKAVETIFDCVHVNMSINQAIPVSLIVNEVVTNSIKHAFDGREGGKITVGLKEKDKEIELRIRDNGIGLPDGFEKAEHSSLGLHLITILAKQLEAQYNFETSETGTVFTLLFTKTAVKGAGNRFF